jgi:hypothetical protein
MRVRIREGRPLRDPPRHALHLQLAKLPLATRNIMSTRHMKDAAGAVRSSVDPAARKADSIPGSSTKSAPPRAAAICLAP